MIAFKEAPGNRAVWVKLSLVDQQMREGIRRGFFELGKSLKREANTEILRKPRSGNVYFRVGFGRQSRSRSGFYTTVRRRHVASLPYETHANWTGKLRKSIGWKVAGFSRREFGYGVSRGNDPEYAPFVEFGTFGKAGRSGGMSSRMLPRPSLENAIKATRRDGEVQFVEAINRELK